ncbi:MAG: radical SAM family heme chaperone HemW [Bacillota bacterium]
MKIKAIYVHLPFCLAKCNYCDFNSYPLPAQNRRVEDYLACLAKELELAAGEVCLDEITTLYLGGGTPTVLTSEQLVSLAKTIYSYLDSTKVIEATIEANPGTLSIEKLTALKSAGFNRLSLGIQSLNDALLKDMGRIHDAKTALSAFNMARKVGWGNINVDLIYGLPGQTIDTWLDTLNGVIRLEPEHIAVYGLSLDDLTPWGSQKLAGSLNLPDESQALQMYESAKDILQGQGYIHYEISNYSLPQRGSQHNLVYWTNNYYIGIGSGAGSYFSGKRYYNVRGLDNYIFQLEKGLRPIDEIIDLTIEDEMAETMFMGLRLMEGVNIAEFHDRFGVSPIKKYAGAMERLASYDLLVVEKGNIKLTEKGIPLGNVVFQEFV